MITKHAMGPTRRFAPSAPGPVLPSHRDGSKGKSDELFSTSSRPSRFAIIFASTLFLPSIPITFLRKIY